MSNVLKLGIPAGSLQEATRDLFERAGYAITFSSRSYYPNVDDDEIDCLMVRAQEMARYVEQGVLDAGITGHDWVIETGADVRELCELRFSKVSRRPARWVLCVPSDSPVQSVSDLPDSASPPRSCTSRGRTSNGMAWTPTSSSPGAPPRRSRPAWPTRLWK